MKQQRKLSVAFVVKELNETYHRNWTLADVASRVGVSRETLSRLSSDSKISVVYAVAKVLYALYPESGEGFYFDEWLSLMCLIGGDGMGINGSEAVDKMDEMVKNYYEQHKSAFEYWSYGEPVRYWWDSNGILCIEYRSGNWWHYKVTENGLEWW